MQSAATATTISKFANRSVKWLGEGVTEGKNERWNCNWNWNRNGNSKSHLQFGKLKFVIEMRHGLLEPQNANAYLMCSMQVWHRIWHFNGSPLLLHSWPVDPPMPALPMCPKVDQFSTLLTASLGPCAGSPG